jgi:hypothetical protein
MSQEKYLAFRKEKISKLINVYQENGTDSLVKFYMDPEENVVAVTDEYDSEAQAIKATTKEKQDGFKNIYHGPSSAFIGVIDEMTVSDIVKGSVSSGVAMFTMLDFGKKTFNDFMDFKKTNMLLQGIRAGLK